LGRFVSPRIWVNEVTLVRIDSWYGVGALMSGQYVIWKLQLRLEMELRGAVMHGLKRGMLCHGK